MRTFTCSLCRKEFTYSHGLELHIRRVHTKQFDYHCEICKKGFIEKSQLREHMFTHVGERPFACNQCDKKYSTRSSLSSHKRYIHPAGNHPSYDCHLCGFKFPYQTRLLSHLETHAGIRKYLCDFCGTAFVTTSALRRHRKSHEPLAAHSRSKVCTICGSLYASTKSLHVHMRLHTGEKPVKCPECDKCFTQHSSLYFHIRTHHKDVAASHEDNRKRRNLVGVRVCRQCGLCCSSQFEFDSHIAQHDNLAT